MLAEDAAAKFAGHQDRIAGLGAVPAQLAAFFHLANRSHANYQRPRPSVGVSSGDGHVEFGSERQQTFVERLRQLQAAFRQRDEGVDVDRLDDVAEIGGQPA